MPHLKPTALLLTLALLSGCGPEKWAVQNLEEDQATCASGKQWACDRLAHDQVLLEQSAKQHTKWAQEAATGLAVGVVLLPIAAAAAAVEVSVVALAISEPQYVVVARCRWGCW